MPSTTIEFIRQIRKSKEVAPTYEEFALLFSDIPVSEVILERIMRRLAPLDGKHLIEAVAGAREAHLANSASGHFGREPGRGNPSGGRIGEIRLFTGGAVRSNDSSWLICDGRILAIAAFPRLFDVIRGFFSAQGDDLRKEFRLPLLPPPSQGLEYRILAR